MYIFSHKSWGPMPPYTHVKGTHPIDGGYISAEVEVVNLLMLNFTDSPSDHRLLILNISTKSLLGKFRHKVVCPVSRCLITSQQSSVDKYNQIIRQQFEIHQIEERLDAVDRMTHYCGYPSPGWLRAMIIKLYKQMMEIRQHTKKKCYKILCPRSNFRPTVQMWYDRIHAYLQLIRLKEGEAQNIGNIMRFAKHTHIKQPEQLTLEELQDGLQLACIRKPELCKQVKGLSKVLLQDCLIDAQNNHEYKRAAAIKRCIH
jgi:hypothetical protein